MLGRLFLSKEFYDGGDFDWLFDSKAKRYIGTLKKKAQKSVNIAAYLQQHEAYEEELEQSRKNRRENPERNYSGIALSLWLKKKADSETVLKYANVYLVQHEPAERAEALKAFSRCPFPMDPAPIIEDAKSDFEPLRNAAWWALENIRHPAVRAFAMEQVDWDLENALPVLIRNYKAQDEALLIERVKSIPVDFEDATAWHGILTIMPTSRSKSSKTFMRL